MPFPKNPRVVVTGAGGGLGRAFCKQLAARGARIVAADIRLDLAEETVRLVGGAQAFAVACDVAKLPDVEALAVETERLLGGVDLVVNNAGVAVSGAVGEIAMADWHWIMGVNLWGVIHGCHVFVPRLKAQKSGHIINVASAAGLLAAPGMAPYNVVKAGVVSLSETLFGDLRADGVGVSALCPTFFRTNITRDGRGIVDDKLHAAVERQMDRASLQADDVATIALDQAQKGRLYILPHRDGRMFWRLKRAAPQRFHEMMAKEFVRRTAKSKVSPSS